MEELWEENEKKSSKEGIVRKHELFNNAREYYYSLKSIYPDYLKETNRKNKKHKLKIIKINDKEKIFGFCPVRSEKTLCCNLRTLDVIMGCPYYCKYCAIQSFYSGGVVTVHKNLRNLLESIKLDPTKEYHIGTGQSSDALALGNNSKILDELYAFIKKNPNVYLEFKTKSKNIEYLLKHPHEKNIFPSWSLNTDKIIKFEEPFTASFNDRIKAAKKVIDKGYKVGFHFHPIVTYENYEKEYKKIIEIILKNFDPKDVIFVSFGTLHFAKSILRQIRAFRLNTKTTKMINDSNIEGKFTIDANIKHNVLKMMYDLFKPWQEKVFFYFCMEDKKFTEDILGISYKNNDEFEEKMIYNIKRKLK